MSLKQNPPTLRPLERLQDWLSFPTKEIGIQETKFFNEQVLEGYLIMGLFSPEHIMGFGPGYIDRQIKKGKSRADIILMPVKGADKIIVELKRLASGKSPTKKRLRNDLKWAARYIYQQPKTTDYGILTYGNSWYLFKLHKEVNQTYVKLLLFFDVNHDLRLAANCLFRLKRGTIKSFFTELSSIHDTLTKDEYKKLCTHSPREILNILQKGSSKRSLSSDTMSILKVMYSNIQTLQFYIEPIIEKVKVSAKDLK